MNETAAGFAPGCRIGIKRFVHGEFAWISGGNSDFTWNADSKANGAGG
jgi:hypothetical protein